MLLKLFGILFVVGGITTSFAYSSTERPSVLMTNRDRPPIECYACSFEQDELCITVDNFTYSKICGNNDKCRVWRFYSEKRENETYYLERGCSPDCNPGCVSLDDMENRFMSCTTCCSDNLCNVGNNALPTMPIMSMKYLLPIAATLAFFIRN